MVAGGIPQRPRLCALADECGASAGPSVIVDDLVKQTHDDVVGSGVLGIGYLLGMFAVSVALVNHLVGPMVARNRHVTQNAPNT